jgi:hypothetical protein
MCGEACKNEAKMRGVSEHMAYDFIGAADGAAIAAEEFF